MADQTDSQDDRTQGGRAAESGRPKAPAAEPAKAETPKAEPVKAPVVKAEPAAKPAVKAAAPKAKKPVRRAAVEEDHQAGQAGSQAGEPSAKPSRPTPARP